jgi:hypothetical protein
VGGWFGGLAIAGCRLVFSGLQANLVFLYAYGISIMDVGYYVFGEVMVSVVSLACVGLGATCWCVRVLVCVVCVWWLGHFVMVRFLC